MCSKTYSFQLGVPTPLRRRLEHLWNLPKSSYHVDHVRLFWEFRWPRERRTGWQAGVYIFCAYVQKRAKDVSLIEADLPEVVGVGGCSVTCTQEGFVRFRCIMEWRLLLQVTYISEMFLQQRHDKHLSDRYANYLIIITQCVQASAYLSTPPICVNKKQS